MFGCRALHWIVSSVLSLVCVWIELIMLTLGVARESSIDFRPNLLVLWRTKVISLAWSGSEVYCLGVFMLAIFPRK